MTTQPKPQPTRTITLIDLSQDIHTGTLTTIAICLSSQLEELLVMCDRGIINLCISDSLMRDKEAAERCIPDCLFMPGNRDRKLLVLGMDRAMFGADSVVAAEGICILPEHQWPAHDQQFDDFFGSLRSLLGKQITWHATISGTESDPRLGRIIVQYRSSSHGSSRIAIEREEAQVSRKVSMPRPIA